jgi:hypothetical protein
MPLIMGVSNRVYCLETGQIIAEGSPEVVRNDAKVVASYLGTDERAIARSGGATSGLPGEAAPADGPDGPAASLTAVSRAAPDGGAR